MDNEHLDLLAKIAHLYYEQHQTQKVIAQQFGYSRSMISRLLSEAEQQGVVEIRIHYPISRCVDLEVELREKLGLKVVRVLARGTLPYEQMLRRLGQLAASLVEDLVTEGMVIGVSWGTALLELTNALSAKSFMGANVVQIIGALDTADPQIDGPDLARNLARIFGGQYFTLSAPLLVENEAIRDALLNDQRLRRVLNMIDSMQMTLVGIGTIDPRQSSLVRAGYVTTAELRELAQIGVVGDVCAIQFDCHGNILDTPLNKRRIGISPEQKLRIPIKLGIAGGETKALSIVGACRAGLVNHLVTDEIAAQKALRILEGDDCP
jgi:DNA-binding transcriptional regulator LsrR (DeoR family)